MSEGTVTEALDPFQVLIPHSHRGPTMSLSCPGLTRVFCYFKAEKLFRVRQLFILIRLTFGHQLHQRYLSFIEGPRT